MVAESATPWVVVAITGVVLLGAIGGSVQDLRFAVIGTSLSVTLGDRPEPNPPPRAPSAPMALSVGARHLGPV